MKVICFTIFAICCAVVKSFEMLSEIIEDYPNKCSENINRKPFVQIGQKYYFIEANIELNWFDAAHVCRTMDANLLTIESADELNTIYNYVSNNSLLRYNWISGDDQGKEAKSVWLWTSGNDLGKEGKFVWLGTGKPMEYKKWHLNNPDNDDDNEHCVHLKYSDDQYYMNDLPCTEMLHFICEANTPKTVAITIL